MPGTNGIKTLWVYLLRSRLLCLLSRANENTLHLEASPLCVDSHGRQNYQPASFQWWFLRYFGDPIPGRSRNLTIPYCYPGSGVCHEKTFSENREVTPRFGNMQDFDILIRPFVTDAALAMKVARQGLVSKGNDDRDDNDIDHGSLEDDGLLW